MSLRRALREPILKPKSQILTRGTAQMVNGETTLADLLAPDGVDRAQGGIIKVGDSYIITMEVRSWPPSLRLGWLSDPVLGLQEPGIIVHQRIEPIPNVIAQRILSRSEKAGMGTAADEHEMNAEADVEAEQGRAAAAALRRNLASGDDRMMQVAITITVCGDTPETARTRAEQIRNQAAQQGIMLGVTQFLQWEGYQSSLPRGDMPQMLRHDMSGAAVAMGMPIRSTGLARRGGRPLVWGEHPLTGDLITWDPWTATNPHMLVIAESGSGKSYSISGLIAQEVALSEDAFLILDPKKQEYRSLVESLGGTYISLSRHAGLHINPLQLPKLTAERAQAVRELEEDLLAERVGVVKALIVRELQAMHMPVTPIGDSYLEQALYRAYAAKGITTDISTFEREMPTFTDVQRALHTIAETKPMAGELGDAMDHFTVGHIGALFNQPSNIPVDNPLLAIDLWPLLSLRDETLDRLIPIIVMNFFVDVGINRPTGRRARLILDEAHALLHTEAGVRTLQTIIRIGRSLKFAGTVITQSVNDLDESEQTRVLLENTKTKLILGLNQESNAVDRVAAILGLNDAEQEYLRTCRMEPGVGSGAMLFADGQRSQLYIPRWGDTIHNVVTGGL